MRKWLTFAMAYAHVRAHRGRMALSVLAVALGVALVVAIRLMNAAVLASFLDTVDAVAGRAALTVSAGEGLTFDETVVGRVAAVPGVALAVPLVRGVAFPDDGSGELLTVHGVDLTHEAAVRVYHRADDPTAVIDDLLVFLAQPDSIVLGRAFATRRGLAVGSRLALVTPRGVRTFTVRGLLDAQGVARTLGGRLVVMDLFAAQQAFTAPGQVNQVDVVVEDGAAVDGVRAAIAAAVPAGLKVEEPTVRKAVIRKTVGGFQAMLTAFSLLAVVAGFVVCYSRLGAIFEARTWEVGLLRAVGLSRAVVFAELLKESLLLGVAGTAIGIPVGIVVGAFALPVLARSTALNFRLPIVVPELAIPLDVPLAGALVGIMAALVAAALPALRLSRRQPVAALRLKGREAPPSSGRRHAVARLVLAIAIAALVAWQWRSRSPSAGNLTTALGAVIAWLLAIPLVWWGGFAVTRMWGSLFGPMGELSTTPFVQQPRRSALIVATLGLGLGAILMFGILGSSFERSLVRSLTERMTGDLAVTSAFSGAGYLGAPLNEAVLDDLRAVTGIGAVAGQQMKDVAYGGTSVVLTGFDAAYFRDPSLSRWFLEPEAVRDALTIVARGQGCLVSTSFAQQHRSKVGDTVRLDSPRGTMELRIVGVTPGQPESAVIVARELYRDAWNDRLITFAHVSLAAGTSASDAGEAVTRALGEKHRLRVWTTAELVDYFGGQVRQAFSLTYLMEAVTFLLVSIGIADTLATGIFERTRDLGVMRAIGVRRGSVATMVVLEGTTLGLFGTALAAVTGVGLGAFWVYVQFPAILGWRLGFHFPFGFAAMAGLVTVVLGAASSLLPALRVARLPVAEALRNE